MDFINITIFEYGDFKITVWSLILLAMIYIATKAILGLLWRIFVRVTKRRNLDPGRQMSLYMLSKYVVWTVSILTMLGVMGLKPTLLLASSAALLVGIGLGLQQIFQDIISGIFLLFEGTIEVGDVLDVEGKTVKVKTINLRTSEVLTRDGVTILMPNHKFITENVINWTHSQEATRFHVLVGVEYSSDLEKVRDVLYKAAEEQKAIIQDNPQLKTSVRIVDFADSAIVFEVLFWTHDVFWVENTKSDLRFTIGRLFKENSIGIPFPQRDLHLKTVNGKLGGLGSFDV